MGHHYTVILSWGAFYWLNSSIGIFLIITFSMQSIHMTKKKKETIHFTKLGESLKDGWYRGDLRKESIELKLESRNKSF